MRRTGIIIVIAVLAVTVVVLSLGVAGLLADRTTVPPAARPLPDHALTPTESTSDVRANPDGTLSVSQRLVFETPVGSERPIVVHLGRANLGWADAKRNGHYIVLPGITDIRAEVLPAHSDDPEAAELVVIRQEEIDGGGSLPSIRETIGPADPNGRWSPGRHAVLIEYVLTDVFVEIDGRPLLIIPADIVGAPEYATTTWNRIHLEEDSARILCLPENVDFAPQDCSGTDIERSEDADPDPARRAWKERPGSSVKALGFDPPASITATPQPVLVR